MNVTTSHTLLGRLKDPEDEEAWASFWDLYTPLIMGYCLQQGISQQLAEEIVQETMVSLMKALAFFEYDPARGRFRAFLLRVMSCRIKDAWRRHGRERSVVVASPPQDLEQLAGSDDRADAEWELRCRQALLLEALERIRIKIHKQTFRAFEMYVLEGEPAAAVAETLGMERNAVYQQKNRVIKLLTQEIAFLEEEDY